MIIPSHSFPSKYVNDDDDVAKELYSNIAIKINYQCNSVRSMIYKYIKKSIMRVNFKSYSCSNNVNQRKVTDC